MTPDLWCAPNVHLAQIDDDIVVLDLLADQYRCLVGAADAFRLEADNRIIPSDTAVAEDLVTLGIAANQPASYARPAVSAAGRDLDLPRRASRLEILRAGVALSHTTASFQNKSLQGLLHFKGGRPSRPRAVDEATLANLVAAARMARPWIPFEGECLQRSFQLRCYLASRGVAVSWMFGVRTWPFAAHCWLQVGDLLVGDRLDRVRRFTPIMSV